MAYILLVGGICSPPTKVNLTTYAIKSIPLMAHGPTYGEIDPIAGASPASVQLEFHRQLGSPSKESPPADFGFGGGDEAI